MKNLPLWIVILMSYSCNENPLQTFDFKHPLNVPTMLVNRENDNTIEGNYLIIIEQIDSNTFRLNYSLTETNFIFKHSSLGWGNNIPLYDAGSENLRTVISVEDNIVRLGALERGKGYPKIGQRIVFWNFESNGYKRQMEQTLIDPSIFNDFLGKSMGFGDVVWDEKEKQWIMYLQEVDTLINGLYLAVSKDLVHWKPYNKGKSVLSKSHFKGIEWAESIPYSEQKQIPRLSSSIYKDGKWYFFMYGYHPNGKRHIGMLTATDPYLKRFEIIKEAILKPEFSWCSNGVYTPKITAYKDKFLLFYTGQDIWEKEQICRALTKDLIHWEVDARPSIDYHQGWRSSILSSEPAFIDVKGDSVFLFIAGMKNFKMGAWHHYVTRQMYMGVSGNVDDAQLGIYLTVDGGRSFMASKNNPVFVNDYRNDNENDHMGGNFKYIHTDSLDYIFYQAKTTAGGLRYAINLKSKK